jgi:hypothetical protein
MRTPTMLWSLMTLRDRMASFVDILTFQGRKRKGMPKDVTAENTAVVAANLEVESLLALPSVENGVKAPFTLTFLV